MRVNMMLESDVAMIKQFATLSELNQEVCGGTYYVRRLNPLKEKYKISSIIF